MPLAVDRLTIQVPAGGPDPRELARRLADALAALPLGDDAAFGALHLRVEAAAGGDAAGLAAEIARRVAAAVTGAQ